MLVEYRGRKLLPRLSASRELEELGLDLFDVVEVLEDGFNCASGGRWKQGILERCLRKGDKILRTVVSEGLFVYPDSFREEVFYVIHVSKETIKKRRFE